MVGDVEAAPVDPIQLGGSSAGVTGLGIYAADLLDGAMRSNWRKGTAESGLARSSLPSVARRGPRCARPVRGDRRPSRTNRPSRRPSKLLERYGKLPLTSSIVERPASMPTTKNAAILLPAGGELKRAAIPASITPIALQTTACRSCGRPGGVAGGALRCAGVIALPLAQKCSDRRLTLKRRANCSQVKPLRRRSSAIAPPARSTRMTEAPAVVC